MCDRERGRRQPRRSERGGDAAVSGSRCGDTEEADLGAEMPGIGGDLDQCLGTGAEQQSIDQLFVLQSQRRQLMGKREDDMRVRRCEQFAASRGQPTVTRLALTLGAVPVPARVIGDGPMTAS